MSNEAAIVSAKRVKYVEIRLDAIVKRDGTMLVTESDALKLFNQLYAFFPSSTENAKG